MPRYAYTNPSSRFTLTGNCHHGRIALSSHIFHSACHALVIPMGALYNNDTKYIPTLMLPEESLIEPDDLNTSTNTWLSSIISNREWILYDDKLYWSSGKMTTTFMLLLNQLINFPNPLNFVKRYWKNCFSELSGINASRSIQIVRFVLSWDGFHTVINSSQTFIRYLEYE
jgi:hypothetical protein